MDNISTLILAASLIIIMYGMGLSLVANDFKRIISFPKSILVGLVSQLLMLPLIGFALISVIPVDPAIAVGVIILAACPGGPTSNLITHLAKGDTALSVSLTALSSIITVFTIPVVVNIGLSLIGGGKADFSLNIMETITQTTVIVIVPVLLGMFLRATKSAFAKVMATPVRIASGIVLALVIVGLIFKEKDHVYNYFEQAGVITLFLNIATLLVGWGLASLAKLPQAQRISIAVEGGIQNGTLAITIATVLLGNTAYAIAPAIYSLLMFLTGAVVIRIAPRTKHFA